MGAVALLQGDACDLFRRESFDDRPGYWFTGSRAVVVRSANTANAVMLNLSLSGDPWLARSMDRWLRTSDFATLDGSPGFPEHRT